MRLLIIEDHKDTALTLKEEFAKHFVTEIAYTGEDGEYKAQVNGYDVIVLDYLLPDINGLEICKKLRENNIQAPIIMLTGENTTQKKVALLDAGADDYVTKPFNFEELLARIRALLRRNSETFQTNVLSLADLCLDAQRKTVTREKTSITLRRKEFYLLEYLMRNAGRVVTREMILNHAWDSSTESVNNIVDVHIKYLRDRIDKPFEKKLIKTIHGLGYKIEA